MRKYFIFMLIAVPLFASYGLVAEFAVNRPETVSTAPTATPAGNSESLLYLDKQEVVLPAPPGRECRERNEDMIINVTARGINVEERKNTYQYAVSGGRVLDEGKNVRWDLSGARPGIYKMTIKVGDGEKTKESTAVIIVRECMYTAYDCACPEISASGYSTVKAGEAVAFTANVSGGTSAVITYNWTISQGEIIDGQGTPTITVKTDGKMKGEVKATVEIGGEMCADCPKTASAIARIIK